MRWLTRNKLFLAASHSNEAIFWKETQSAIASSANTFRLSFLLLRPQGWRKPCEEIRGEAVTNFLHHRRHQDRRGQAIRSNEIHKL